MLRRIEALLVRMLDAIRGRIGEPCGHGRTVLETRQGGRILKLESEKLVRTASERGESDGNAGKAE